MKQATTRLRFFFFDVSVFQFLRHKSRFSTTFVTCFLEESNRLLFVMDLSPSSLSPNFFLIICKQQLSRVSGIRCTTNNLKCRPRLDRIFIIQHRSIQHCCTDVCRMANQSFFNTIQLIQHPSESFNINPRGTQKQIHLSSSNILQNKVSKSD